MASAAKPAAEAAERAKRQAREELANSAKLLTRPRERRPKHNAAPPSDRAAKQQAAKEAGEAARAAESRAKEATERARVAKEAADRPSQEAFKQSLDAYDSTREHVKQGAGSTHKRPDRRNKRQRTKLRRLLGRSSKPPPTRRGRAARADSTAKQQAASRAEAASKEAAARLGEAQAKANDAKEKARETALMAGGVRAEPFGPPTKDWTLSVVELIRTRITTRRNT
jgi:hypothetical protein